MSRALRVVGAGDASEASAASADRLITTRQLARALQTSEREVQRLARRVPSYRIGRQHRFVLDEVLAALREEPQR